LKGKPDAGLADVFLILPWLSFDIQNSLFVIHNFSLILMYK
jgi:hypothetical protein